MAAASSSNTKVSPAYKPMRVVRPDDAVPLSLWGMAKQVPYFSKKSYKMYDTFPQAVYRAINGTSRNELICVNLHKMLHGPFNIYWHDDEPGRWSVVGIITEEYVLTRIQMNPRLGDIFITDFTDKEGTRHIPTLENEKYLKWLQRKWTYSNFKQAAIMNFPLSFIRMRAEDYPESGIYFGESNVCIKTTKTTVWPAVSIPLSNLRFERKVVTGRLAKPKDGDDATGKIAFVSDHGSNFADVVWKCEKQGYLGVIFTPNACSGRPEAALVAPPLPPMAKVSTVGGGRGRGSTIPQWRKEQMAKEEAEAASLQAAASSSAKSQSDGPSIPREEKSEETLAAEFDSVESSIPFFRITVDEKNKSSVSDLKLV
jgi:hypothetical protein